MHLKQEQRTQRSMTATILLSAFLFRIPKSVTQTRVYARGHCYPVCPSCRSSLDREYMAFCDRCGQRLAWEEYADENEESGDFDPGFKKME